MSWLMVRLIAMGIAVAFAATFKLYAAARGRAPDGVRGRVKLTPMQQIVVVPVMLLLVSMVVIAPQLLDYRKLVAIRQHGARAEAQVDDVYTSCGKHSCSRRVRYHFTVAGQSATWTGDERLGSDRDGEPHAAYAGRTGHVPIAYDTTRPNRSALNFDNSVFTAMQETQVASSLRAMGGIMTIEIGLVTVFLMVRLAFSGKREFA